MALATATGRRLYYSVEPLMRLSRALGRPTFEAQLLTRHRVIDRLLTDAIADDRVGQVIEIAAGLSPRGWRFANGYPELTYVEADLPDMAARKRDLLSGETGDNHRIVEIDALADEGPDSLDELAATLDPERGTAIITEGLLNYFDRDVVEGMWRRFASTLAGFRHGLFVANIHVGERHGRVEQVARLTLGAFVRGGVHLHFATTAEAEEALRAAGFTTATLYRGNEHPAAGDRLGDPAAKLVQVIEATT